MGREQKTLKWLIRLMLPVFLVAGFGGYASLFVVGMSVGRLESAAWSPDGRYRASIINVESVNACGFDSHVVRVERRWGWVKTGEVIPFCFVGDVSQLKTRWVGRSDLEIVCLGCDQTKIYQDKSNWGALHYRYDIER